MYSEVTPRSSVYVPVFFYPRLTMLMPPLKDVDWHATKEGVFASVGDDKLLMMYKLCDNKYVSNN